MPAPHDKHSPANLFFHAPEVGLNQRQQEAFRQVVRTNSRGQRHEELHLLEEVGVAREGGKRLRCALGKPDVAQLGLPATHTPRQAARGHLIKSQSEPPTNSSARRKWRRSRYRASSTASKPGTMQQTNPRYARRNSAISSRRGQDRIDEINDEKVGGSLHSSRHYVAHHKQRCSTPNPFQHPLRTPGPSRRDHTVETKGTFIAVSAAAEACTGTPRRKRRPGSPRNPEHKVEHGRGVVPRQLVDAVVPVGVGGDGRQPHVLRAASRERYICFMFHRINCGVKYKILPK